MTKAANGSDLDVKTTETRTVKHYHYLQWKDFNAPEHAPAMLRFVKRINEDHLKSRTLNPPILVHCSAGVGRSGTLVAIDGLIQQLREEGQLSIYNTVCDLRHQRNFLVQSVVSEYIFSEDGQAHQKALKGAGPKSFSAHVSQFSIPFAYFSCFLT